MNNSWKDLFTFSRKEQGGMAVLLVIILLLIAMHPIVPLRFEHEQYNTDSFRKQAESFLAELEYRDSLERSKYMRPAWNETHSTDLEKFTGSPFYFDPNTISEEELLNTGIREPVAKNILNYRKKGGKFKKPEDLKKIYNIDMDWYAMVIPYIRIQIETRVAGEKNEEHPETGKEVGGNSTPAIYERAPIRVELNSADSAELVQCTGIGPSFAKRILSYRQLLGGYYNKDQLLEVFGMDTARYSLFKEQVWVNEGGVRKMDINRVDFKEMLRHPYFEYYLVKAIFSYKDRKKSIDSVGELKGLPEIYPELYEKISPYLEVNP